MSYCREINSTIFPQTLNPFHLLEVYLKEILLCNNSMECQYKLNYFLKGKQIVDISREQASVKN